MAFMAPIFVNAKIMHHYAHMNYYKWGRLSVRGINMMTVLTNQKSVVDLSTPLFFFLIYLFVSETLKRKLSWLKYDVAQW